MSSVDISSVEPASCVVRFVCEGKQRGHLESGAGLQPLRDLRLRLNTAITEAIDSSDRGNNETNDTDEDDTDTDPENSCPVNKKCKKR